MITELLGPVLGATIICFAMVGWLMWRAEVARATIWKMNQTPHTLAHKAPMSPKHPMLKRPNAA